MENPVSGYCDYLDKEMTIMGLLSAFAVLAGALVLDRTAGAESTHTTLANLWKAERLPLGAGSLAFAAAGFFFYKQRSLLAYYVGQLRFSQTDARYAGITAKGLLEDADSWATWTNYQTAFVLLTLGVILYGFALYPLLLLDLAATPQTVANRPGAVAGSFLGAAFVAVVNWLVMTRYRYHDRPWFDCFHLKKPLK
jgi:hypothetical protein